jgi:2,3-bisphosphoglycerate-dependent phosphoglycerate mutase
MHLYLIRHAESQNNARPAYERVEDPSITAVGRMQADYLAQWMKSLPLDHLITSPFKRTLQTMQFVTNATKRSLQVWHDVFEQGGCFRGHGPNATEGGPGLGHKEIVSYFPDVDCVADATIDNDGWWVGKNRETEPEHQARARSVIGRIVDTFDGSNQTVVMIIHAQFERELLRQMLPDVDAPSLGFIKNCSITKLNRSGQAWQLDWFNSVTHLPAKLITGNEM